MNSSLPEDKGDRVKRDMIEIWPLKNLFDVAVFVEHILNNFFPHFPTDQRKGDEKKTKMLNI
jgi:hypothetical protein